MSLDSANLVFRLCSFSGNRRSPKGFIVCFAFQVRIAIADATASFRQQILAFVRTTSDRSLSESLVLVMERAVALMALLISSVTVSNAKQI